MWNAAPSSKCHLCVNGAFAKIIKCLKYINDWRKEKRKKCGRKYRFCTYNIGGIEWAMRRSSSKQIQSLLMPAKMLCARLLPLRTLWAVPFSRWWVWVAVYRSLNTGFECKIYHGLAHKMCFVPFFFRKIFTCKTQQDTASTDSATNYSNPDYENSETIFRYQKKAQRRNVQKPFLIHKFQNGLSYLILK